MMKRIQNKNRPAPDLRRILDFNLTLRLNHRLARTQQGPHS
ncbi:MAG: hypothetical protein ACKOAS_05470 [Verrucomicrobiota bacterium]